MSDQFAGFPAELFDFLSDLSRHNNRSWFQDNKARYYQYVAEPMADFISAMVPRLAAIDDNYIADPRRQGGSMFRIYRDTRFSKDKRPYKDYVGCQFRHQAGRNAHSPGFYLHLEPTQVYFGGGIWKPDSSVLHSIRCAIAEHPQKWQNTLHSKAFMQRFGSIQGDQLKRPPRGFTVEHPSIKDLKRKSFYAMQQVDPALASTADFIEEVTVAFRTIHPLMQFITAAVTTSTAV